MEPPLTITLIPPPAFPGNVELLTVESQAQLSVTPSAPNSATTLFIPNDFIPGLCWGVLGDMLAFGQEAADPTRAAYARQRFDQYVELMTVYPFIFTANVGGKHVYCDAVEVLDSYSPGWRMISASPSIIGMSGKNLIAFPVTAAANVTLFMLANATVPVNDSDFVQLGQEVIDAILDYAQHTASFKMGGEEFTVTLPLMKGIVEMASQRNAKVRALSTFREVLYGQSNREAMLAPTEKENTE